MECKHIRYDDQDAVLLSNGIYEAMILPTMGANCISLRHLPTGYSFFRTPSCYEELKQNPNVYGLPLLFPPNRIGNGRYTFEGREYGFPINEPARGNHIHGVLSSTPFEETQVASFTYTATKEKPYLDFPHAFMVCRKYDLSENGLKVEITFTNLSPQNMPMGTGIHAAWNVNFANLPSTNEYKLQIPLVCEWEKDEIKQLSTEKTKGTSEILDALKEGSLVPEKQALSHQLEIEHKPFGLSCRLGTFYGEASENMRFMMLWNGGGGKGFLCPEPQSWITNAPNLALSPSQSGFSYLKPGETRSYRVRYWFESSQA